MNNLNIFCVTDKPHKNLEALNVNLVGVGKRQFNQKYITCFNGKNIHYNSKDKDLLIKNTLRDIYMIIKSNYFIPSLNSGISKWIIFQKENPPSPIPPPLRGEA